MSVIRSVHDRYNPYVQINKKALEDPKISLKAKGFIAYCLSKPDNWIFHVNQLCTVLKEQERSIYNTIKECIDHDYAIRWRKRDKSGKFEPWQTIISDSQDEIRRIRQELNSDPEIQKSFAIGLQKSLPHRCFPHVDVPHVENAGLLKNEGRENDEVIIKPRAFSVTAKKEPAGGNNNPSGKSRQKTSAAAGNNNSPDVTPVKTEDPLEKVEELVHSQKAQFAKYPPPLVAKAVKYCRHIKLKGDQAFVKQMHAFCKNPEDYADTFENLGKKPQKFSKEEILSRFKRGELYNGHEFLCDNLGCGFLPSWGCGQGDNPYSVYWRNGEKANAERWKEILQKLGIKNE